jgi:NHLM bacteriocin system ABC transporter peptidase/ATP-binding protein
VPTVLQIEETECGAAALGMVLAGFGRYVPLEELRTACGVTRDGSKASSMLKAARSYDLEAKGFRRSLPALKDATLPAIIFWRYSHWVVLEGFAKNGLLINDPADGRRHVPLEEAQQAFSGVSLEFSRGPGFTTGGHRNAWVPDLIHRMRPARYGLLLAVVAGLFLIIPGVLVPLFTTVFVNNVISTSSPSAVGGLLVAVATAATLIGLLTLVQQIFLARVQTRLTVVGSFRLVDHLVHLPVQYFTQRYPGVLVSRLDQVDQVSQLLAGPLVTAAVSLIGLLVYVAAMFAFSPVLTLVGIGASLLNVVALAVVARQRDAANQQQLRESSRLQGLGMSTITSIESVKTAGAEDSAFERWAGFQARSLNATQKMGTLSNAVSVVPTTLASLTSVLIITVGGLQVLDGSLTLGVLVGFQALMSSFLTPISSMVTLAQQAQVAQGQLLQINDVLANPTDPQFAETGPTVQPSTQARLDGRLELRDVTFGYDPTSPPLIEGFSLSLGPGQRVALVGGSGSGKSTIVRLILGLYQPWSGEVLFDGKPRDQWPRSLITTSVAFVDQTIMLFEGTIRDNLTLWDTSVPQSSLIRASRDACIHDDIVSRTGGYLSDVQEDGRNFSGGQRQRLEIARALTLDPSILVLDEATSALDSDTERIIDRNLRRRGTSSVIVAHRLSTIRDCDEIIVLDGGRIVQRGTHDALVQLGGRYASLIEAE